jgi:hypothetical protein
MLQPVGLGLITVKMPVLVEDIRTLVVMPHHPQVLNAIAKTGWLP